MDFEKFKEVFAWVNNMNEQTSVAAIPLAIDICNCLESNKKIEDTETHNESRTCK